MFKVFLLIFLLALAAQQDLVIRGLPDDQERLPSFRCEVRQVDKYNADIRCATSFSGKQPLLMRLSQRDPALRAWRLELGPNDNADPREVPLRKGQVLKATWDETTGDFIPIATCEVRRLLRIRTRARNAPGELIAIQSLPDDCQPWWQWPEEK